MKMQKRQFRIGELAHHLGVEKFVVRFWEKEFKLRGSRSTGGQRFYKEKDLSTFKKIKKLLYEEGFTIAGAKKQLKQNNTEIFGSHKTTLEESEKEELSNKTALTEKLVELQNKLKKIQNFLC